MYLCVLIESWTGRQRWYGAQNLTTKLESSPREQKGGREVVAGGCREVDRHKAWRADWDCQRLEGRICWMIRRSSEHRGDNTKPLRLGGGGGGLAPCSPPLGGRCCLHLRTSVTLGRPSASQNVNKSHQGCLRGASCLSTLRLIIQVGVKSKKRKDMVSNLLCCRPPPPPLLPPDAPTGLPECFSADITVQRPGKPISPRALPFPSPCFLPW